MSTYKGIVYFLICPSMWYAELTSWECCPRGGSVLASCVRARALAPTNVTARTSWQCSRVSHRSLLSLYSHCILKKKKLPLALYCQGVIFLGAYNWLIPKKVLNAIRTSALLRKRKLWFLKCVIDVNYQLLIWKRNFILFFLTAIKKDTKGSSCSCLCPE